METAAIFFLLFWCTSSIIGETFCRRISSNRKGIKIYGDDVVEPINRVVEIHGSEQKIPSITKKFEKLYRVLNSRNPQKTYWKYGKSLSKNKSKKHNTKGCKLCTYSTGKLLRGKKYIKRPSLRNCQPETDSKGKLCKNKEIDIYNQKVDCSCKECTKNKEYTSIILKRVPAESKQVKNESKIEINASKNMLTKSDEATKKDNEKILKEVNLREIRNSTNVNVKNSTMKETNLRGKPFIERTIVETVNTTKTLADSKESELTKSTTDLDVQHVSSGETLTGNIVQKVAPTVSSESVMKISQSQLLKTKIKETNVIEIPSESVENAVNGNTTKNLVIPKESESSSKSIIRLTVKHTPNSHQNLTSDESRSLSVTKDESFSRLLAENSVQQVGPTISSSQSTIKVSKFIQNSPKIVQKIDYEDITRILKEALEQTNSKTTSNTTVVEETSNLIPKTEYEGFVEVIKKILEKPNTESAIQKMTIKKQSSVGGAMDIDKQNLRTIHKSTDVEKTFNSISKKTNVQGESSIGGTIGEFTDTQPVELSSKTTIKLGVEKTPKIVNDEERSQIIRQENSYEVPTKSSKSTVTITRFTQNEPNNIATIDYEEIERIFRNALKQTNSRTTSNSEIAVEESSHSIPIIEYEGFMKVIKETLEQPNTQSATQKITVKKQSPIGSSGGILATKNIQTKTITKKYESGSKPSRLPSIQWSVEKSPKYAPKLLNEENKSVSDIDHIFSDELRTKTINQKVNISVAPTTWTKTTKEESRIVQNAPKTISTGHYQGFSKGSNKILDQSFSKTTSGSIHTTKNYIETQANSELKPSGYSKSSIQWSVGKSPSLFSKSSDETDSILDTKDDSSNKLITKEYVRHTSIERKEGI